MCLKQKHIFDARFYFYIYLYGLTITFRTLIAFKVE